MSILNLSVTHKCNYDCLQCGTKLLREQNPNRKEVLTPETIRLFLKNTSIKIKAVSMGGGGEPTTYKRLPEFSQTVINEVSPEYFCTVSNNSYPKRVKELAEAVLETDVKTFLPGFSIDGLGEVHDRIRSSPGAFNKAVTCLELTNKLREEDDRIVPGISFTLGPWNYKELLKMFYFSLSFRTAFSFRFAMPINSMGFTEEIYEYVEEQIKTIDRMIGNELAPNTPVNYSREFLKWIVPHARTGQRPYPCRVPELNLWIDAYGDIYPCCGSVWVEPFPSEEYKLGNILSSNLDEIYNSDARKDAITKLKDCQMCWDEASYALTAEEYVQDLKPLYRPKGDLK